MVSELDTTIYGKVNSIQRYMARWTRYNPTWQGELDATLYGKVNSIQPYMTRWARYNLIWKYLPMTCLFFVRSFLNKVFWFPPQMNWSPAELFVLEWMLFIALCPLFLINDMKSIGHCAYRNNTFVFFFLSFFFFLFFYFFYFILYWFALSSGKKNVYINKKDNVDYSLGWFSHRFSDIWSGNVHLNAIHRSLVDENNILWRQN